jgi:acetyltransferase-like isoleucine patch superfamily enzyme
MIKSIIKKLRSIVYLNNLRKNNIFDIFEERNVFHYKSNLFKTKWGRASSCNANCDISYTEIGNYTEIAMGVIIGPRNHIHTNFTFQDFVYENKENIYKLGDGPFDGYFNKIGHDVWIGRNAIILQGVEIGIGSIVAAGSIVVKSVPPYSIVGGSPAKLIRKRYNDEVITNIDTTKWYLKSKKDILKNKNHFERIVSFNLTDYNNNFFNKKK